MRVRTSVLFMVVLFISALVGCGGAGRSIANDPPTSDPPSAAPALKAIAISPSGASIAVGKTQQLKATGTYSDGSSKDVSSNLKWSSSAPNFATVNNSGMATAVAAGQTKVTATSGAVTGSTTLSVTDNLLSIAISSSGTSVDVAGTLQLTALGTYQDDKPAQPIKNVSWTSSASNIASVSSGGLVTGVKGGTATITASAGAIAQAITITVVPVLKSISVTTANNASSTNVGSSLQFHATANYNDGSSLDITGKAVWTSSATNVATVSSSGLLTGLKGGAVTITASLGSFSNSLQISVVAVLQSISLSPVGPAIVVGSTQQFSALGSYNDGTAQDLTAKAQWSSSDTTKASLSSTGLATAAAAGPTTVLVTYQGVTATTALNVVSKTYASFTGPYAFSLTSVDSRGPTFFAGTITAGAKGSISGVEDSNTGSGVHQNVPVTGSYLIYPDGRGNITFNPNACHPSGITLRFLLASGGSTGSLIEFDGRGNAKGGLALQNRSAFNAAALNGTYVFRSAGIDSGANSTNEPQPIASVGLFAANGAGLITSGIEDINDHGVVSLLVALSQSAYSVSGNGRGSLQLINASGTTNYAFYIVDSTRVNLIEHDATPATAVAGVAELQTAQSYVTSSLSGSYAFLLDRPDVSVNSPNFNFADYEQIGQYAFDGKGNVSGFRDWETITGTDNVSTSGTNGRGVLSTTGTAPGSTSKEYRTYLFYIVSPSEMFLLQTYSLPTVSASSPESGEADLQIDTPYNVATLAGSFALGAFDLATDAATLILVNFDGSGGIGGIADVSANGGLASVVIENPQYVIQTTQSGLTEISLNVNTSTGIQDYGFYVVSSQKAWVGGLNPPLDGSLTQQ